MHELPPGRVAELAASVWLVIQTENPAGNTHRGHMGRNPRSVYKSERVLLDGGTPPSGVVSGIAELSTTLGRLRLDARWTRVDARVTSRD